MEDGTLRISPSQINKFLTEPSIWVLNKFHKFYGDGAAKMWAGTAVEKGLESILVHGLSYEDALEWAYKVFDIEALRTFDEKSPEHRAKIPAMLQQALDLILPLEGFTAFQTEIFGEIEGLKVKGKIDFDFTAFDLDLKTTGAMQKPENMSSEHLRQLAIYRMLRGKEQRICYVTEKKGAIYIPTDAQYLQAEQEIRGACRAMKTAWDLGQDMAEKLYPPFDYSSYLWDEKLMKKAKETWR